MDNSDRKITEENIDKILSVYKNIKSIDADASYDDFLSRTRLRRMKRRRIRTISVAATVALMLLAGGVLLHYQELGNDADRIARTSGNIVLTLPDGSEVVLDGDRSSESIADYHDVSIRNTEGGGVEYVRKDVGATDCGENTVAFSSLSVPAGNQYDIILEDGTHVWLNSETTLIFPVRFTGGGRMVEIIGEAYFKVAQDMERPFVVNTGNCDIRVTGTEFNVKNYNDSSITTLIEGRVQVEYGGRVTSLEPGQQAVLHGDRIFVASIETDDIVAWRTGAFSFRLERLEDIMSELSRWYGIDIKWSETALKDSRFSAYFSRTADLEEIVDILQKTRKVKLSLHGNTLTVGR